MNAGGDDAGSATRRVTDFAVGLWRAREGLAFHRGGAALYGLFSALRGRFGPGDVVIPALCCETVSMAALYAGHGVRMADVDRDTLAINEATLEPLLNARTRAVVLVHLFGIDAGTDRFDALRRAHPQVTFIEDIAHAVGGRDRVGRLLGGGLDYGLISFARSKIVAGDGGALLFFPSSQFSAADIAADQAERLSASDRADLALSLRNMVHALADLWRFDPSNPVEGVFPRVVSAYRGLIVGGGTISDPVAALAGLGDLEALRKQRFERYLAYRKGIRRAEVVQLHDMSMCWRCPVLFQTPALAREATRALRAASIHASNHYFPLNRLLGGESCPVSEDIALRIVNLWVDSETDSDTIERTIGIINAV